MTDERTIEEVEEDLQTQLIRQEHRTIPVAINFWKYVFPGKDDGATPQRSTAARRSALPTADERFA